jgi:putative FmdB family regulatory protein
MPIYEYRCKSCGHHLEALQKVSEGALRKCPECGKLALQKLVSAAAFRLKGGGWYETDFKSDGEKKRNLVESGEGAAKEPAEAGKSADAAAKDKTDTAAKPAKESKPAAKPAKSKSSKKAARPAVNG